MFGNFVAYRLRDIKRKETSVYLVKGAVADFSCLSTYPSGQPILPLHLPPSAPRLQLQPRRGIHASDGRSPGRRQPPVTPPGLKACTPLPPTPADDNPSPISLYALLYSSSCRPAEREPHHAQIKIAFSRSVFFSFFSIPTGFAPPTLAILPFSADGPFQLTPLDASRAAADATGTDL